MKNFQNLKKVSVRTKKPYIRVTKCWVQYYPNTSDLLLLIYSSLSMASLTVPKKKKVQIRYRNLCTTLFNHEQFTILPPELTYLVSGQEICPETKQDHLQVYAEAPRPLSTKMWQQILSAPNAHCESRKGTALQASDYCKKDAKFIELGELSHQGNSSEWLALHAQIRAGTITVNTIVLEHPQAYHKFGRVLTETETVVNQAKFRDWVMNVTYIWGSTGTGKTRYVMDKHGYPNVYIWNYEGKQDEYTGQDTILFDEFKGQIPYNDMLRLLDRYPYTVQRRYRNWPLVSHNMYIISSRPIEQCYPRQAEQSNGISELLRRVNSILSTNPAELFQLFGTN